MIKHLACIMDGNRRWAIRKGWFTWQGHKAGLEAVKRVVSFCLENNIPYVSLYTFSLENFKRSDEEKNYLFDLIISGFKDVHQDFIERGIKVCFIGDRSLFPANVIPTCERIEQETAHLTNLQLNLLFCYGAQQEIVGGIKRLVHDVKVGKLSEDDISNELFERYLWTRGIPEPDLIVRTGGAQRLSNFLLYQAAYSEFYFLDCLWPDITKKHLTSALLFFNECQRNVGT